MATLTEAAKQHIVQALACFDTPTQVVESVKEEFGVEVGRQQVAQYDPTKASGKSLSKKWRAIFDETRGKFLDKVSDIPISQRAFRLRALGRMATQAEKMRNIGLAVQVIEQAAKEVGDVYVNRRVEADKSLDDEIKLLEIEKRRAELKALEKGGGNSNAQLLADLIAKLPS